MISVAYFRSLIAICAGGLESEIMQDILASLLQFDPDARVFCEDNVKNAIGGQIRVETTAQMEVILSIRSVQIWLINIVSNLNINSDKTVGLGQISDATLNGPWLNAQHTWDLIYPGNICGPVKFCARCIREGVHGFNSMDVARTIGDAVVTKFSWTVNLTEPDVEVVAIVLNNSISIGLNVFCSTRSFKNNRLPPEKRPPAITTQSLGSLRSSTVYTIVSMLRPKPGEILVDYLCGVGGSLVEAVYAFGVIGLGGDGDESYRSSMLANGASLSSLCRSREDATRESFSTAEYVFWTIARLPLRTAAVDLLLANIPSGKCKRSCRHSKASLHRVVAEIARVLRCGGRTLVVCESGQQLRVCVDSDYFESVTVKNLRLGGHICVLLLATRSEVPFRILESNVRSSNSVVAVTTAIDSTGPDSKRQRMTDI